MKLMPVRIQLHATAVGHKVAVPIQLLVGWEHYHEMGNTFYQFPSNENLNGRLKESRWIQNLYFKK